MRAMNDDGCQIEPEEPAKPSPKWRKAKPPVLAQSATAEEALIQIVVGGTDHLRANEVCVIARAHDEGIHQMRVASRRLRSALTLYRDDLPAEQFGYLNGELKWLIGELGPARDWDVFVGGTLEPVLQAFPEEPACLRLREEVERTRGEAYERAAASILSQRYVGLILLLKAWAEGRRWHDGATVEQLARLRAPAVKRARELLDQHYQETLTLAGDFAVLTAEERHKVRIQIKKLRYATEFFGGLFPRRMVTPLLGAMKNLQDLLGVNNDVEVARQLLKEVPKRTRGRDRRRLDYAAGLIVGWHSHVSGHHEQNALRAWKRFTTKQPFWRPTEKPPGTAAPAEQAEPVVEHARPEGPSDPS